MSTRICNSMHYPCVEIGLICHFSGECDPTVGELVGVSIKQLVLVRTLLPELYSKEEETIPFMEEKMSTLKVFTNGPGAVGKTCLLMTYFNKEFPLIVPTLIGKTHVTTPAHKPHFLTRKLGVRCDLVKLYVWDYGIQLVVKIMAGCEFLVIVEQIAF
jgi:hypothetical protein